MDFLQAIILGLLQGLTEFLPVSSSGHLILAPHVFGFKDQGLAMDAILHLATLLAIFLYFKDDLIKLFKGFFSSNKNDPYRKLAWSIVVATIPAGVVGLAFEDWIEVNLRSTTFVACNLIFWSIIFFVADRTFQKNQNSKEHIDQLSLGKVFFIGCAQAIALLPGTSRSGITIAAGLFQGLNQVTAARFSFLLGTPVILAAGLLKSFSIISKPSEELHFSTLQLGIGFFTAFLSGYFAIKLLMNIVSRYGLFPFIIYRLVLAAGILIYFSN